jgi:hypothetical protein
MATATQEQTRLLGDTAETVHTLLDNTTRLQRSLETFDHDGESPSKELVSQP